MALVSIDNGQKLRDTYGQPVMDQLHCFVGNQWKRALIPLRPAWSAA